MIDRDTVRRMDSPELLRRLLNDVSGMVDKEVALAKAEVRETAGLTVRGVVKVAIGAALAAGALFSLLVAGILALAMLVPGWVAGLIAFGVLMVSSAIFLFTGKDELVSLRRHLFKRTRQSLREDIEWARQRVRYNGK